MAKFLLPPNWQHYAPDHSTEHLLRQALAAGLYYPVACLITRACLEQLVRGWKLRDPSRRDEVKSHRYGFRINNGLFYVLPQVDDGAMDILRKLARVRLETTVLAPPWSEFAASGMATAIGQETYLQILGIGRYVTMRACFHGADFKLDRAEVLTELFQLYNRLARQSGPMGIAIRV
jgi:hypothetical protein